MEPKQNGNVVKAARIATCRKSEVKIQKGGREMAAMRDFHAFVQIGEVGAFGPEPTFAPNTSNGSSRAGFSDASRAV